MLSPIEEIKSKINIVDVVGKFVRLQKAGINYKANCPFHNEKTPSFFVSPARQTYKCFGCGKGGDVFQFIQDIEGIEFGDALRQLAQQTGIVLRKEDPQLRTARSRMYEIVELATHFFETNLRSNVGTQALAYLKNRGISDDSLQKFRVGFSLESWDGLIKHLRAKGYRDEEIEGAGLAIRSQKDPRGTVRFYDRFRNRITFPVTDLSGQVVGFSARIMPGSPEESAKYINTPETLIYNKSRLLYGLSLARTAMRQNNSVLLVEGNMDCVASHQAGASHTVATSGTALTAEQLSIIRRYTDKIIFSFDADSAGLRATERAIEMALAQEFSVQIVIVPEGKDPADFIQLHPEKWIGLIDEARPIMEFYFEDALQKGDASTLEGQKKIAAFLLPKIKLIPNAIERSHWIEKLSEHIGVASDVLREEMQRAKTDMPAAPEPRQKNLPPELKKKTLLALIAEKILAFLPLAPHLPSLLKDAEIPLSEKSTDMALEILSILKEATEPVEYESFAQKLSPAQQAYLSSIIFEKEAGFQDHPPSPKDTEKDLNAFVKSFKLQTQKEQVALVKKNKNLESDPESLKKMSAIAQTISHIHKSH